MSYTDTFRVSYDDEMVTLSIKQSEFSVLQVNMTYEAWETYLDDHRNDYSKYINMAVPISDRAIQYIRVPSRDFRHLVAEYELQKNAGN